MTKEELDLPKGTKLIENYVHISDRFVLPRAVAVLPDVLQIRRNIISPRRPLPTRVRFGPVQGKSKVINSSEVKELVKKSVESKEALFLLKTNENFSTHIDKDDHDKSNWLSLLPLGDQMTANVWLYEEENELYAITTKSIPSRVSLMLGYSSAYIKMHGFPPESPALDIHEVLSSPPSKWWCSECQCAMPSAALLQNHIHMEHKVDKTLPRRRYKCQRCKKTFTRLFTLKRHTSRHCTKKDEKRVNETISPVKESAVVESEIEETNPILEESRVPSEEILQNLTASLDFNSLFDTYRISSLDLSGSAKSGVELCGPENELSKDDNGLTNLTDPFINISNEVNGNLSGNSTSVFEGPVQVGTVNTTSVRSKRLKPNIDKKQEHVSNSPKEIFSCECGHLFPNKDKLIRHVKDHSNCSKTVDSSDIMYKCEDCQLIFKRRGMFVNHLWRVHKNNTTSIPLERRVRYYPCVACSKIYCTAAKRDRHVKKHHPGAGGEKALAVESGRRSCAAAACAACPRQYATRAKLMQHIRAAHPLTAPPVKTCTPAESNT